METTICIWSTAQQHTHTHPFNGPFSGTTWVGQYQKGKTNLDFTEARDSEWQWHQLGHMQVCTSLQTDNHASTSPLIFLQAGCPSCRPTNSVKALQSKLPTIKKEASMKTDMQRQTVVTANRRRVRPVCASRHSGRKTSRNTATSSATQHH